MLRRPWDDSSMTFGSTPISSAKMCQCLTIAAVLSIIVPSKSKSKPATDMVSVGAENDGSEPREPIVPGKKLCLR